MMTELSLSLLSIKLFSRKTMNMSASLKPKGQGYNGSDGHPSE